MTVEGSVTHDGTGYGAGDGGLEPFDLVLLQSFGGPDGPEDVMPFLRNVTGGRGIPDERLAAVAEHYYGFGGRSPINDCNRALVAALRAELAGRGVTVPVVWGNRNWAPYLTDTLRRAYDDGYRRPLVVTTSAYSSYSSCRQYREDLARALATLEDEGRHGLVLGKIRQYYNHPAFAAAATRAAVDALARLEGRLPAGSDPAAVRLLFVTHSVPDAMDRGSGRIPGTYRDQHEDLMAVVAGRVRELTGVARPAELVFCSRSGAPGSPWLEPDVNDRMRELVAEGPRPAGVVAVPIGFVSDHMEVVFDLDTEARATAQELGLPFERAATVGTDPGFVAGLADLCQERAAEARGGHPDHPAVGGLGPVCSRCSDTCCTLGAIAQPAWQGEVVVPPVSVARH